MVAGLLKSSNRDELVRYRSVGRPVRPDRVVRAAHQLEAAVNDWNEFVIVSGSRHSELIFARGVYQRLSDIFLFRPGSVDNHV